ncbi:MAG: GDP-mannose 4,6-dehydratase [Deltaproteobacteria bacterium]|nr:GDP-mannose 4,6-dehydratase [Deltaproteobacteria bacterium]
MKRPRRPTIPISRRSRRLPKILITGAGGFIGSHLAERCVELGWAVRALVRYNSRNHWGFLDRSPLTKEMEVLTGDIRDFDSVHRALEGCQAVFHLAALIGIPYSYSSPLAYLQTNGIGAYNILQSARMRGLESVVITSTSETYGTAQYVPIDENHPPNAQSPYAASKIAADQLALSYFRSFGLPVKIARPFNTYGPRQSARAIIPTIISQILAGRRVLQLGNLTPTRDLSFVKDTAEGIIEIYKSPELIGEVVNIGQDQEIAMGDLCHLIASLLGVTVEIHSEAQRLRPEGSEVERLRCNPAKIKGRTAWRPRYTLKQGLQETIAFLQDHRDDYKPDLYNL